MNAREFYDEVVLPALFERLDAVFPEFGWKRTVHGWQASNREFTKSRFDARPQRIESYSNSSFGFVVHGGDGFQTWTDYIAGQRHARGQVWFEAVKALAVRAGVDCSCLDRGMGADDDRGHRRHCLLQSFLSDAHKRLLKNADVMTYLCDGRGMLRSAVESSMLGLCPSPQRIKTLLLDDGFTADEIAASQLLTDRRWHDRLLIPWCDVWGRVATIAARRVRSGVDSEPRYLFLKGTKRPAFYGLEIARQHAATGKNLVIVEGLLDVNLLHGFEIYNVVAIGSTGHALNDVRLSSLAKEGIRSITLMLDQDAAGERGIDSALANSRGGAHVPEVFVIPPHHLRQYKDPGEMIAERGIEAYSALLSHRVPRAIYEVDRLLGKVHAKSPLSERREAVVRAIAFMESLKGPRAALEREDMVQHVAERTGYSADAVSDPRSREVVFKVESDSTPLAPAGVSDPSVFSAIVEFVKQAPRSATRSQLGRSLRGVLTTRNAHLKSLSGFGSCSDVTATEMAIAIDYLLAMGRLELVRGKYVTLPGQDKVAYRDGGTGSGVRRPPTDRPLRAGKPWAAEEDARLIKAYGTKSISELAVDHERSVIAIEARLVKHGLLDPDKHGWSGAQHGSKDRRPKDLDGR